jgi:hypothetical protein
MTREQAVRAYVARVDAVDRLTERAAQAAGRPSGHDLVQLADIQSRLAIAAAQIVAALSTPATNTTQEG